MPGAAARHRPALPACAGPAVDALHEAGADAGGSTTSARGAISPILTSIMSSLMDGPATRANRPADTRLGRFEAMPVVIVLLLLIGKRGVEEVLRRLPSG